MALWFQAHAAVLQPDSFCFPFLPSYQGNHLPTWCLNSRTVSYPHSQTPCYFLLIISASLAMFCTLYVGGLLEVKSIPEHSSKLSPNPKALGNHLSKKPSSPPPKSQMSKEDWGWERLLRWKGATAEKGWEPGERERCFPFLNLFFPFLNSFLLAVQFILSFISRDLEMLIILLF